MKKHCIILVGIPCVGKSTWCDEFLKNNPEYLRISFDSYLENMAKVNNISYLKAFDLYKKEANKALICHSKFAFNKGFNVIIDMTNINVKSRAKNAEMFRTYTKDVIVFPWSNWNEYKRRVAMRDKKVPWIAINSIKKNYEPPKLVEGFNSINKFDNGLL